MADLTSGLPYLTSIVVTEFPINSIGQRFSFTVKVFTDYAVEGIESTLSESIILADLPDKPISAPTRNIATSQTVIAVNILVVPGDHGSPIQTYIIEIDDGLGNQFTPIQGADSDSLSLTAQFNTDVKSGNHYRVRYRVRNEIGFGPYSDVAYILAAVKPDQPTVLSVTIEDDNTVISWLMPYNGGALIYSAEIKI